ncbi:MAG TPA: cytochrome c oxidase subunit II [Actinomycetota bacterium]
MSRHPLRRVAVRRLLPVVALLTMSACGFGAPPGASEQGQKISGLYRLMFWIAIVVGVVVLGLIAYSIVRFRRRNEDLPRQTRYHLPLEVTYTVIPVVIVLFIFGVTYHVEHQVDHVSADPEVRVDATAFQWQWRFTYPQYGITIIGTPTSYPTFEVPVGQTVQIDLRAQDVIHAFYVPEFLFKRDAIPGHLNVFDFTVPEPGRFAGECAEFCGLNHAFMGFWVKAVPRSEFDAWVQQQQVSGSPSPSPGAGTTSGPPSGVTPTPIASQTG